MRLADVRVRENESASRFEAVLDGRDRPVGVADYEVDGHTIVFTHTVVPPELRGHGIAGLLVQEALDVLAARGGLRVVPRCSYVKDFIDRNPDYAELLRPPV